MSQNGVSENQNKNCLNDSFSAQEYDSNDDDDSFNELTSSKNIRKRCRPKSNHNNISLNSTETEINSKAKTEKKPDENAISSRKASPHLNTNVTQNFRKGSRPFSNNDNILQSDELNTLQCQAVSAHSNSSEKSNAEAKRVCNSECKYGTQLTSTAEKDHIHSCLRHHDYNFKQNCNLQPCQCCWSCFSRECNQKECEPFSLANTFRLNTISRVHWGPSGPVLKNNSGKNCNRFGGCENHINAGNASQGETMYNIPYQKPRTVCCDRHYHSGYCCSDKHEICNINLKSNNMHTPCASEISTLKLIAIIEDRIRRVFLTQKLMTYYQNSLQIWCEKLLPQHVETLQSKVVQLLRDYSASKSKHEIRNKYDDGSNKFSRTCLARERTSNLGSNRFEIINNRFRVFSRDCQTTNTPKLTDVDSYIYQNVNDAFQPMYKFVENINFQVALYISKRIMPYYSAVYAFADSIITISNLTGTDTNLNKTPVYNDRKLREITTFGMVDNLYHSNLNEVSVGSEDNRKHSDYPADMINEKFLYCAPSTNLRFALHDYIQEFSYFLLSVEMFQMSNSTREIFENIMASLSENDTGKGVSSCAKNDPNIKRNISKQLLELDFSFFACERLSAKRTQSESEQSTSNAVPNFSAIKYSMHPVIESIARYGDFLKTFFIDFLHFEIYETSSCSAGNINNERIVKQAPKLIIPIELNAENFNDFFPLLRTHSRKQECVTEIKLPYRFYVFVVIIIIQICKNNPALNEKYAAVFLKAKAAIPLNFPYCLYRYIFPLIPSTILGMIPALIKLLNQYDHGISFIARNESNSLLGNSGFSSKCRNENSYILIHFVVFMCFTVYWIVRYVSEKKTNPKYSMLKNWNIDQVRIYFDINEKLLDNFLNIPRLESHLLRHLRNIHYGYSREWQKLLWHNSSKISNTCNEASNIHATGFVIIETV